MDNDIQELLKLAGIGHKPVEYNPNKTGEDSPLTTNTLEDEVEEDFLASKGEDDLYNPEEDTERDDDDEDDQVVAESNEEDVFDLDWESEDYDEDDDLVYDIEDELEIEEAKSDPLLKKIKRKLKWMETDPKELIQYVRNAPDDTLLRLSKQIGEEPWEDSPRLLQIKVINQELKRRFGVSPSGKSIKEDDYELDMDDDDSEMIHPKSLSMHNTEIDDEEQDVMIRFESEEAHDLIDELFGALAERGIEGEIILPPRVRGSVEAALADAGFEEESDYHFVDPMTEVDLNNGYGSQQDIDADDYFPSGDTGPAAKELGPSAARHGNNPLATRMNVKESGDLYKKYLKEYKQFKR